MLLSVQRDAASIIAHEGVCLQTPVENDPLSLDGQRAGIAARDGAFQLMPYPPLTSMRLPAAEITP